MASLYIYNEAVLSFLYFVNPFAGHPILSFSQPHPSSLFVCSVLLSYSNFQECVLYIYILLSSIVYVNQIIGLPGSFHPPPNEEKNILIFVLRHIRHRLRTRQSPEKEMGGIWLMLPYNLLDVMQNTGLHS